jgi:hypothetical protein
MKLGGLTCKKVKGGLLNMKTKEFRVQNIKTRT